MSLFDIKHTQYFLYSFGFISNKIILSDFSELSEFFVKIFLLTCVVIQFYLAEIFQSKMRFISFISPKQGRLPLITGRSPAVCLELEDCQQSSSEPVRTSKYFLNKKNRLLVSSKLKDPNLFKNKKTYELSIKVKKLFCRMSIFSGAMGNNWLVNKLWSRIDETSFSSW